MCEVVVKWHVCLLQLIQWELLIYSMYPVQERRLLLIQVQACCILETIWEEIYTWSFYQTQNPNKGGQKDRYEIVALRYWVVQV